MGRFIPLLAAMLLLGACQPKARPIGDQPLPAPVLPAWPAFDYEAAGRGGARVFMLDPESGYLDIIVRREGPMARFGHDHVVTVQQAEGYLLMASPLPASKGDIRFLVDRLLLDSAEKRSQYGLDTDPDDNAVDATRSNMLTRVLNGQDWPDIRLSLSGLEEINKQHSAHLDITTNGVSHSFKERFELLQDGTALIIQGQTVIRQSALDLQPFSVLGGGLRVADEMEIHFRLRAVPWSP